MRWFADRSLERMRSLLMAIRSRDFSMRFPMEGLRGKERELAEEMNGVVVDFHNELLHQERLYGRYEAMLNTIGTALIMADNEGKVLWMNKTGVENLCGFRITTLDMLAAVNSELPQSLRNLTPGQTRLLGLHVGGRETRLKISMVKHRVEGEDTLLYSIEDVHLLVEQNEIEAQRKLVSVLTHEIMNSLSPIISLSNTLCEENLGLDDDVQMAVRAINRRSRGLLTFVENYRRLSRVATPKPEWTYVRDLFEGIMSLYPDISYNIEEPELQLRIDRHQVEQVLINLIKNAVEACGENPEILISATSDHPGHIFLISVRDNGSGISPDAIDNIFVPFFTTKNGGSGIGLSLSRQIISMHGGSIKVASEPGSTTFTIMLPLIYRL